MKSIAKGYNRAFQIFFGIACLTLYAILGLPRDEAWFSQPLKPRHGRGFFRLQPKLGRSRCLVGHDPPVPVGVMASPDASVAPSRKSGSPQPVRPPDQKWRAGALCSW
jgi:hypothetical protein